MGLAIKGLMDGVIDNQNQWLDCRIICWRHSEKGDGNGIKMVHHLQATRDNQDN